MPRMRSLFAVAAAGILASCTQVLDETRATVVATAAAVNQEFVTVRTAEQTLVAEIADWYHKKPTLDLSTEGMDVAEGGLYQTFPGNKYYYKSRSAPTSLYLSPGKPVTDEQKRQVRFLEFVEPSLVKAYGSTDVLTVAFYGIHQPTSIALMAPWSDVVSVLPPGIDLTMFEWYNRGLHSAGGPLWSAAPFADFTSGWVMDVSAPVSASKDGGVTVISVNLEKLSNKYLAPSPLPLLLAGQDGTVVGLTASAQTLLNIRALEAVDYLRQMKENSFAPGKYKLGDPSQPPEIQALARSLASGQPEFEVSIQGRAFTAVQRTVPETNMVVVGFAAR